MKNIELIHNYFEGTLSDSEREVFEYSIKNDPEFLNEFNFQKELQNTLKKEERRKTKEFLKNIDSVSTSGKGKINNRTVWLAAASIILIIGFSLWIAYFNSTNFSTEQLYSAYYKPYENVVHPLERGEETADLKSEAFLAYESGNYELALSLFNELKLQSSEAYYNFYTAIALMALEKFEEAKPLLHNYIVAEGELKDRAYWYLALTYLRLEETEKAKEQLDVLIELEGFKYNDANELKEQLP